METEGKIEELLFEYAFLNFRLFSKRIYFWFEKELFLYS